MKRVIFKLSMPSRGSWNGQWSGQDRNYTITKKVTDKKAAELDGKSYFHRWSDGWCAEISARIVQTGERLKRSDGFCGYDWMVENIWLYGNTKGEALDAAKGEK